MMEAAFNASKWIPLAANRLEVADTPRSEIARVVQVYVLELLG